MRLVLRSDSVDRGKILGLKLTTRTASTLTDGSCFSFLGTLSWGDQPLLLDAAAVFVVEHFPMLRRGQWRLRRVLGRLEKANLLKAIYGLQ